MADIPKQNPSDAPGPDLSKEREQFIRAFSRGTSVTRQFIEEYEALQRQLLELQEENGRLRAAVEAEDAIRDLLKKISTLESEKKELLSRYQRAEAVTSDFNDRFQEMESEFSNLANLFVAANSLHSSLSPRAVTRRIQEVLEQLLGSEQYGIYLSFAEGRELLPLATSGLGDHPPPIDAILSGPIGEVARSGAARIDDAGDPSQGSFGSPPAVFPLQIDDKVVGVIAIFRSFSQKTRFTTVDFELFKLLGQHGAVALMSAGLFAHAKRKLPGPEAFGDLDR